MAEIFEWCLCLLFHRELRENYWLLTEVEMLAAEDAPECTSAPLLCLLQHDCDIKSPRLSSLTILSSPGTWVR